MKEPEQMLFKPLLYMARNEFACPEIDGCKREFAVNQALLLSRGNRRLVGRQRQDMYKRQYFLLHRIRELERQKH